MEASKSTLLDAIIHLNLLHFLNPNPVHEIEIQSLTYRFLEIFLYFLEEEEKNVNS